MVKSHMLRRLKQFLLRPIADAGIETLYRACVAQARQPVFYADLHVPDTVEGRYDLLILHVILILHRLQEQGRAAQQLFDILFADMDRNLREMGVSDIRIAKKIKPLLEAFYGRAQAYTQALAATDETLTQTLNRNIYGASASPEDSRLLTNYVRHLHTTLAAAKMDAILSGSISFPQVREQ